MAAAKSAARIDNWREYFKTSNGDIFETIEKAIMIAASDHPKEFGIRRDSIAQTLFNCKLIKCYGCDKVEVGVPEVGKQQDYDDNHHKEINVSDHQVNNYNYEVAEALTDEIEEESQMFGEVMRIKVIVENYQDESESVLYNSLRKLQLMDLSVETLKATEIGKSVNVLRKHASNDVSTIAKTLIEFWKRLVDEWMMAAEKTIASEATPESLNPSVLDEEEGLPSPPLDDLGFLYSHGSLELSQFFDGMDDCGNPGNSGLNNQDPPKPKQKKPSSGPNTVRKNEPGSVLVKKKQPTVMKPVKPVIERKLQNGPKRPQETKQRVSGDATGQDKFEAAKRKLQERYQQAENAKRQRTIQVIDLPKPNGIAARNQQNVRPSSNHNRHR